VSYAESILEPNERIVATGRPHWIHYGKAFAALVAAIAIWIGGSQIEGSHPIIVIIAAVVLLSAIALFAQAWFQRWTTEFVVTDRRVIYKTGFIRRHTVEMNMDKVETVQVDQTVLGRILNYGNLHVLGTGQGIEHLHMIGSPLTLRNAITTQENMRRDRA
jgi:uncharacterized membrane protein YdbT with pleckstrin-like domain